MNSYRILCKYLKKDPIKYKIFDIDNYTVKSILHKTFEIRFAVYDYPDGSDPLMELSFNITLYDNFPLYRNLRTRFIQLADNKHMGVSDTSSANKFIIVSMDEANAEFKYGDIGICVFYDVRI